MSTHKERMAKLYAKPCTNCGAGLNGQQGQSPNLADWHHSTEMDCIRAVRIEAKK